MGRFSTTRFLPSLSVSASTEKQPQGVPSSRAAETWGGVHQGPAAPQETRQGRGEPSPCSCFPCLKL